MNATGIITPSRILLFSFAWCLCALLHNSSRSGHFTPSFGVVSRSTTIITGDHEIHPTPPRPLRVATSTPTESRTGLPVFHENVAILDGKPVVYRIHKQHVLDPFPATLNSASTPLVTNNNIVVGVLSAATSRDRRNAIRQSWGQRRSTPSDHAATVLFLVGGSWDDDASLQSEFAQHQDLVWVNCSETYQSITWKVATFYTVAARHFPNHYGFKADDDSYVRLDALQRELADATLHNKFGAYWGMCNWNSNALRDGPWAVPREAFPERRYPRYGQGGGYLLSPQLLSCMAHVSAVQPVIPVEDGHSGIIARTCRASCRHTYKRVRYINVDMSDYHSNPQKQRILVLHHVKPKDEQNMQALYRIFSDKD